MKLNINEFYSKAKAEKYLEKRSKETGNDYYIGTFKQPTGRQVWAVYAT